MRQRCCAGRCWPCAALVLGAAGAVYHSRVRPRMLRWGATEEEARGPLPGDELVPDTVLESTCAVTIDALPSAVWPWLVQVGYGRAGWYSYDPIEWMMFAGKYAEGHSATRIHPEFQDLGLADDVPFGLGVRIPVTEIDPERHLVLGASWAFVLHELPDGRTRLLVRTRGPGWTRGMIGKIPGLWPIGAAIDYVVGEPLHHFMERKMILGLAKRAEQVARAD